jgi:hypothetical protein
VEFIKAGSPCVVNGTFGIGLNTQCNSKKNKESYCRNVLAGTLDPPQYQCVQCLTNCDCKMNQYCSSAPGQIGQCKKFDKYGDDCFGYQNNQLTNRSFPEDLKCAMLYELPTGGLAVDQRGVCINQKCRYCSMFSGGGLANCADTSGIEDQRRCWYPGKQGPSHSAYWRPEIYYLLPTQVWWAIFFCLLIITFMMQIISLFCLSKKGGGSGKDKKDSFKSSHASEIGTHNTGTAQHSTISPQTGHSSSNPTPYDNPPSKHSTQYQDPPEKKDPPPYVGNETTPPPYDGNDSKRNTQQLSEVNY